MRQVQVQARLRKWCKRVLRCCSPICVNYNNAYTANFVGCPSKTKFVDSSNRKSADSTRSTVLVISALLQPQLSYSNVVSYFVASIPKPSQTPSQVIDMQSHTNSAPIPKEFIPLVSTISKTKYLFLHNRWWIIWIPYPQDCPLGCVARHIEKTYILTQYTSNGYNLKVL